MTVGQTITNHHICNHAVIVQMNTLQGVTIRKFNETVKKKDIMAHTHNLLYQLTKLHSRIMICNNK